MGGGQTARRRLTAAEWVILLALLAMSAVSFDARAARADDDQPDSSSSSSPQFWAVHGQFTAVSQYHPAFHAAYSGPNSLNSGNLGITSNDATLFLGVRPWSGAEIWINPEVEQGFGLSNTQGVAGFPNDEAVRIGRSTPYVRLQRWFFRQTIDLGGPDDKADADKNQLAQPQSANRLVLTVGKISVVDIFDTNKYANDSRIDFLNWSVDNTGTFDYASDAWGYTYGAAGEWRQGDWTTRLGVFDLTRTPNAEALDPTFGQVQYDAEVEHRQKFWGQPGAIRITGFLTRGRMGSLAEATEIAEATGAPADIAAVRRYASRGGVSLTLEQQVLKDLGVFLRAGWAEGDKEIYEFTDIDRTVSAGASLAGALWGRSDDTIGLAAVVNAPSEQLKAYLAAGGLGVLIGDGKLINSGPERIVETYYSLAVIKPLHLSFDYQFIENPGYNRDRGPVSVLSARVHAQF